MCIYIIEMANQEQEQGLVKHLIKKLRDITIAVQIMPFIYTAVYIAIMVLYLFLSESARFILDTLFYVSPFIAIGFLIESKVLELCRWHRLACILPILPQLIVFIDYHIIELTEIESYISIATPIILAILLLLSAYKVFFSNGR